MSQTPETPPLGPPPLGSGEEKGRPLAYLRAIWTLFWSSIRRPWTTTAIDLSTGEVLADPDRPCRTIDQIKKEIIHPDADTDRLKAEEYADSESDPSIAFRAFLAGTAHGRTAERERCAQVAEGCAIEHRDRCPTTCKCADGWHIAMAIRGGGEPYRERK